MRLRALVIALLATVMLGGGTVTPASADTVSPQSAPVLRFLSYNICGANEEPEAKTPCGPYRDHVKVRVDELKAQIAAWDPDFVFLQEVCSSQYDELRTALAAKGYGGSFATMITPAMDPTGDLCKSDLEPAFNKEHDFGNAVLAKGPITPTPTIELNVGGESPNQKWRSACVQAPLQGRNTLACSVHLNSYTPEIQTEQARKLANEVNGWIDRGTPVVIGGDFNAQYKGTNNAVQYPLTPLSASLNPFYSHPDAPGTPGGRFLETDETDAQHFTPQCQALTRPVGHCRSGEYTVLKPLASAESKYDYIFVSKAHFKNVAADALPRESFSDHYPYRGAATWTHCNNPADGKADLLRRSADGSLYRHFGGHSQVTLHALYCKVGAAWNADWAAMRHLARAGDADGDGAEDLYAIDNTGSLRFFPGHSTETFFRWPRTLTASETWTNAVNMMTVSPDMNGDGGRDLVVRIADGTLTRVSLQPDGGLGGSVDIPAPGAESWSDYNKIVAAGDLTGDGAPDFLARTPAGLLYLYETGPGNTFKPRVQIDSGWNQYDGLVAPGDVNGDGKADLLARDTTGKVWFYAGLGALNGTTAFAARSQSGHGYPVGETLF
ncbi:endonuclease/exonuclease/phosphatase family protein [Streptomyces sp. JNUCC 64]